MQKKKFKKNNYHSKDKDENISGPLLVGLGIGFILDYIVAGLIIGIGIGFIALAIVKANI